MSRLEIKAHMRLLKEAKKYLKDVKPVDDITAEDQLGAVPLTQEHIMMWLETFAEDRIRLDGCNFATVKR